MSPGKRTKALAPRIRRLHEGLSGGAILGAAVFIAKRAGRKGAGG